MTPTARFFAAPVAAVTLALVSACAGPGYHEQGRVYDSPLPARATDAQFGRVRDIEVIPVAQRPSGAGAVLGAVIGGLVGNQFGSGGGRFAATGAGAVAGAVAGNAIEQRRKRDDEVFRVSVRFDDGSVRSFDFHSIDELRVGDRVRLENGQLYHA